MRTSSLVLVFLFVSACAEAPAPETPPDATDATETDVATTPAPTGDSEALDAAIRAQVEADGMGSDEIPSNTAFVDLNGDGTADALAFMQGAYCGTGGCTLYVFEGTADGYTLDSNISLAREPIIVADATTDGWRDLVFEVSGGGAPAKTVVLQHGPDGYPDNASLVAAAEGGPVAGDVVLSYFEPGTLNGFADVVGQTPQEADLWNQPFLTNRLAQLLWGGLYDTFVERMQTVSPVQEESGVYYVTGNMDNAGGSDAAILVADPEQNVLKAWVWQNGELTERAEAPVALDLPSDVETMIQNMSE